MATLENEQIGWKPNMTIIREQCEQVVQRDPALKPKIASALQTFNDAERDMAGGKFKPGLEKFLIVGQAVFGIGLYELEACCFFMTGSLAMTCEDYEAGIAQLDEALKRTRDPFLAASGYNRLMGYYLSNDECNRVVQLADDSLKVLQNVPKSLQSTFFRAAANYNKAEAYFREAKNKEVLAPVELALAGFHALGMVLESAKSLGLRGNARIRCGDVKGGLDDVEKSFAVFRKANHEQEFPTLLIARGMAMLTLGKKSEGICAFREALSLFKKFGDTNGINSTLALLSHLELQ